jgi:YHS domain-containing protein
MAKGPVCKMDVNEAMAEHKVDYKGKTYYFCLPTHKADFEKDPEKYAKC